MAAWLPLFATFAFALIDVGGSRRKVPLPAEAPGPLGNATRSLLRPPPEEVAAEAGRPAKRLRRGRAPARLLPDIARGLLAWVPGPPDIAWAQGGSSVLLIRPGGRVPLRRLRGHPRGITAVQFLPEGDRLVTTGFGDSSLVWDVRSGRALRVLQNVREPVDNIFDMRVLPFGGKVATLCSEQGVGVWHVDSGVEAQHFGLPLRGEHEVLRVFPDGGRLVTGVSYMPGDPAIIWDLSAKEAPRLLLQPHGEVRLVEVSPCGTKLVTAGDGVFVWDAASGHVERELSNVTEFIRDLGISWGGAAVVAGTNGQVLVWDGLTGELRRRLPVGEGFPLFAMLRNPRLLLTVSADGGAVWDMGSGERLVSFEGGAPAGTVENIAVSPDGAVAAACGNRRVARESALVLNWMSMWRISTGQRLLATQDRAPILDSFWPCSMSLGAVVSLADRMREGRKAA